MTSALRGRFQEFFRFFLTGGKPLPLCPRRRRDIRFDCGHQQSSRRASAPTLEGPLRLSFVHSLFPIALSGPSFVTCFACVCRGRVFPPSSMWLLFCGCLVQCHGNFATVQFYNCANNNCFVQFALLLLWLLGAFSSPPSKHVLIIVYG